MTAMNHPRAYTTPAVRWFPKDLHPQVDNVVRLRLAWENATSNVTAARNKQKNYSHKAERAAASDAGRDSRTVDDKGPALTAGVAAAEQARKDAEGAVGRAWATLMMTVADRADAIRAEHTAPVLQDAQDKALAALDQYLAARQEMFDTLGLDQWFKRAGQRKGNSNPPKGGPTPWVPGTEQNPNSVTWMDRSGKTRVMAVPDLLAAMEVDARGHDALRQVEERERAQEARRQGDVAAQSKPVPSGKLRVG